MKSPQTFGHCPPMKEIDSEKNMDKPIWFLADPHLKDKNILLLEKFSRWLDFALSENISHLYILGDLFHYWHALKPIPDNSLWKVVERLNLIAENHLPVTLLMGNRDFLLKRIEMYFPSLKIKKGAISIKLSEDNVYISHGDELCIKDLKYLIYKKFIRGNIVYWTYKYLLSEKQKKSLAEKLSKGSGEAVKKKSIDKLEIPEDHYLKVACIPQKIIKSDIIIHGHIHIKKELNLEDKGRKVKVFSLPKWDETGEFLVYNPDKNMFKWKNFE